MRAPEEQINRNGFRWRIWKMNLEHIGSDDICGKEEQGRPIVLGIAMIS